MTTVSVTERTRTTCGTGCPCEGCVKRDAFDMVSGIDWRAPIDTVVTLRDLSRNGLTIGDISDAILFYTATSASVTPMRWHGARAWHVRAIGYRNGPAGP